MKIKQVWSYRARFRWFEHNYEIVYDEYKRYLIGDKLIKISYGEIEEVFKDEFVDKLSAVRYLIDNADEVIGNTMDSDYYLDTLTDKEVIKIKRRIFFEICRKELAWQKGYLTYLKYLWDNYGLEYEVDDYEEEEDC